MSLEFRGQYELVLEIWKSHRSMLSNVTATSYMWQFITIVNEREVKKV